MKNTSTNGQGTLFLVAIPIGNVDDIGKRALSTLNSVDCIACEDTRVSGQLLKQWNVENKKLVTYQKHNESASTKGLIKLLLEGKNIALVSDAGTPNVSDPGFEIIRSSQEFHIPVQTIPGPSSLTAALSLSTIGGQEHIFCGFLPSQKTQSQKKLKELASIPYKKVVFEAPHRLEQTLNDALEIFGDIRIEVFRELTKPYEEVFRGKISQAIDAFCERSVKGELVLIFDALPPAGMDQESAKLKIAELLSSGLSRKEILAQMTSSGIPRKQIYALIEEVLKKNNEN